MMSRLQFTHVRLLAATTILMCTANSIAADIDPKLEEVRATVSGMFESIAPEDVRVSPISGWYEIQKGSILAYISDDGRYLLQGDLIDLDNQVNLSELSRNEVRRELVSTLSDEDSIMFSPSDVKHTITVFTDIDCTYCRKLHSEIKDYLDLGFKVRYVLYPRNGPASRAWSTSEDVWCARDRGAALTAAKLDREFETSKCNSLGVTKHYALGQDIGLTGTPAIVLEDGTLIGGYLSAQALTLRMGASNPH